MLIIIPKPNKPSYDISKIFQPIVLLNIIGKLIEKTISDRLQLHSIALKFIHINQIEDIKQQSTMDTSIFLTHLKHSLH